MTAQVADLFCFQDVEYSVSGISEGRVFDPSLLGLKPVGMSTACWRGYQAVFAIVDSRLVLDRLHVNLVAEDVDCTWQEGPPVNGVLPTGPSGQYDHFNNHYVGISYPLEYTGGLLLARGFIRDLYVHMGFHPAWKYTSVIELVFGKGVLQHEFDRSEQLAEMRQQIVDSRRHGDCGRWPTEEEIREFVERSFDRTYRMQCPSPPRCARPGLAVPICLPFAGQRVLWQRESQSQAKQVDRSFRCCTALSLGSKTEKVHEQEAVGSGGALHGRGTGWGVGLRRHRHGLRRASERVAEDGSL